MSPNEEIRYAIVNPTDGDVLRIGVCSRASLPYQTVGNQLLIESPPLAITDLSHYWNGTEFVEYPVHQPSLHHKWIGGQWVDPRTAAEVEAEAAAALQARRAVAHLPKLEFILRVVKSGMISPASGLGLPDGILPVELEGMTSGMDPMQLFELQAKLKTAIQIERLDPFIIAAGQYLNMTDAEIDALFGIGTP